MKPQARAVPFPAQSSDMPAFSTGGEERLRPAIAQEVEREFAAELSAATDYWQRAAVEKKIRHEVKERMKRVPSSQSLRGSNG